MRDFEEYEITADGNGFLSDGSNRFFPSDLLEIGIPYRDVTGYERTWLTVRTLLNSFKNLKHIPKCDNTKFLKAIEDSIKHWVDDILVPITVGNKLDPGTYRSGHCVLCKHFGWRPDTSNKPDCDSCPLTDCSDSNSPWDTFRKDITPENAVAMIQALQKCKKNAEKENE